jgi:hypothetical protein
MEKAMIKYAAKNGAYIEAKMIPIMVVQAATPGTISKKR